MFTRSSLRRLVVPCVHDHVFGPLARKPSGCLITVVVSLTTVCVAAPCLAVRRQTRDSSGTEPITDRSRELPGCRRYGPRSAARHTSELLAIERYSRLLYPFSHALRRRIQTQRPLSVSWRSGAQTAIQISTIVEMIRRPFEPVCRSLGRPRSAEQCDWVCPMLWTTRI